MFKLARRRVAVVMLSATVLMTGCASPVVAPTGSVAGASEAPAVPAPAAGPTAAPGAAVAESPVVTLKGRATYHGEALAGYRVTVYDAVTGMQLLVAGEIDAVPRGVRAAVAPLDARLTAGDGTFSLQLANVAASDMLRVVATKDYGQVDALVDVATLLGAAPEAVALDEATQTSAVLMSGVLAVANRQAVGGAIGTEFADKAKRSVLFKGMSRARRRGSYHVLLAKRKAAQKKGVGIVGKVAQRFYGKRTYVLLEAQPADLRIAEPELYAWIVAAMQTVTEPSERLAIQWLLNDSSVSDEAARLFFEMGHAYPDLAWLAAAEHARKPSAGTPTAEEGDSLKALKTALLDCFEVTHSDAAQNAALLEAQGMMQELTDANVELLQAIAASSSTGSGADLSVNLPGTQLQVTVGGTGQLTVRNTVSGQQVDAASGALDAVSTVVRPSSGSGSSEPEPAPAEIKLNLTPDMVGELAELSNAEARLGFDGETQLIFEWIERTEAEGGGSEYVPRAFKRWNFSEGGDLDSVEPLTVEDEEEDELSVTVTEVEPDDAVIAGATRCLRLTDADGGTHGDFYFDGDVLLGITFGDGDGGTYVFTQSSIVD